MNKQTKFVILGIGYVISCLAPLFVYYWIINTRITPATEYYQYLLPCVGGLSILISISGAIFFLIFLIKASRGTSNLIVVLTILFPIAIWALIIGLFLLNPLTDYHMKFQSAIGKRDFRIIHLENANLNSLDLGGADLSGANLKNANFKSASLFVADLTNTNLSGANLQGADLSSAKLIDAELAEADFTDANLNRANFARANLTRAKLNKADLSYANLLDAKITDEQLICSSTLRNATMTDGKKYNGRFNLEVDQPTISDGFYNWWAGKNESMTVSGYGAEPEEIMADYFNVSLEEYLAGQAWAEENLPKLRSCVDE